jgi:hypothetical protein
MSKQTAINLIFEKFNLLSDVDFKNWMLNNHDELKQIEKQQIEDAFKIGSNKGYISGLGYLIHKGRDEYNYYNETYTKEK